MCKNTSFKPFDHNDITACGSKFATSADCKQPTACGLSLLAATLQPVQTVNSQHSLWFKLPGSNFATSANRKQPTPCGLSLLAATSQPVQAVNSPLPVG